MSLLQNALDSLAAAIRNPCVYVWYNRNNTIHR
jgi:hypothetical protein